MTKLELQQRLQAALKTIEQLRSQMSVLEGELNMAKLHSEAYRRQAEYRATESVAGGQ